MTITVGDITWETTDGETWGYHEDTGVEINITGRVRPSMWTTGTNIRDWAVFDDENNLIASGNEEGLRKAKRAALKALNDHLVVSTEYAAVS